LADLLGSINTSSAPVQTPTSASTSVQLTGSELQAARHAKKALAALQRSASGQGPTAVLSAPLSEPQQEQAERRAEYTRAKTEVDKWCVSLLS
jgi:alpha-D-ribose 1-methylphosphonate 5-triphosphate synthase subunit PhnG